MVQMSTVGDERAAPSNAASCFVDVVDRLSGVSGHGWGGLGFCARWLDYDVVEVEGMGAVQPRLSAMQLSAQWCGSGGVSLGGGVSRGGSRRCALGSEAL